MPNPLVIHHNDNDGFCAAWVAKNALEKLSELPEFFEANYGQEPPDVTDRDVFILDFSYKRPVLEQMKAAARSILVIDHHETAKDELAGLDYCIFEIGKAGCQLTREYFNEPRHWLIDYVEDRDLWKFDLWHSKEINAAIASYPKTFDEWDKLARCQNREQIRGEGIAILRYQERLIERACAFPEEIIIDGHKIPIINATMLQSEIGQRLAEGKPFAATFTQKIDGKRTYSLRSDPNGLDVSVIARKHGGGGHKHAAGYIEYLTTK
jgi:oligoribonuclease NrnB/cAMP/cGMP phosphodiesterase (DHH superfamily)